MRSAPSPARPERTLEPEAAADHLSRLYRLAWSLCGSRQLAEDATQETYLRVLSRTRRLHETGDFPYLARTLRNVLNDHWRAERRRAAHAAIPDPIRPTGDPELSAMAGEVFAAVAALPEHLRDVVAAVDVAGMSYAETARAQRIPIGTVMSRLHRARTRLGGALA